MVLSEPISWTNRLLLLDISQLSPDASISLVAFRDMLCIVLILELWSDELLDV